MKYFTRDEFDSADAPGSGAEMNENFLLLLDQAREIAGIPFKINSGYRTKEHNKWVGGSPTSSHMKGLAADIACRDRGSALRIIAALSIVGIRRIGYYGNFIHADMDLARRNPAYWSD